jgi:hypothetical protein
MVVNRGAAHFSGYEGNKKMSFIPVITQISTESNLKEETYDPLAPQMKNRPGPYNSAKLGKAASPKSIS